MTETPQSSPENSWQGPDAPQTGAPPAPQAPSNQPPSNQPPSGQPVPYQPGLIAGAGAPYAGATPFQGGAPTTPPLDKFGRYVTPPTRLGTAFLVIAGVYLLLMLVAAFTAQSDVEAIKETIETGEPAPVSTSTLINALIFPLMVGSYVVYAMWAARIRANREAVSGPVRGPKAVEWWGWFVPIGNFFLIPWGARELSRGATSLGVLFGWWVPYISTSFFSGAAGVATLMAIDPMTGELTNEALLDSLPMYSWLSVGALAISYGFLVLYIRQTTARHLEA